MSVEYIKHFAYIPTKCKGNKWVWLAYCYQKKVAWIQIKIVNGNTLKFDLIHSINLTKEDASINKIIGGEDG